MGYAIFRASDLEWVPRGDESGRAVAPLSDSLSQSRANLWRYPPGARGRRHIENVQEEVFVVLEGTFTMRLGDPPERHELPRGSMVVVEPGTAIQVANESDADALVFVYGAPPVQDAQILDA